MNRFSDLWRDTSVDPISAHYVDSRSENLPSVVSQHSFLHLDTLPSAKNRLVIGVAVWSEADMRLLDQIVEAQSSLDLKDWPRIELFDVAACQDMESIDAIIPGIGAVCQTPVVGRWSRGQLVETGSGFAGRQIVAKCLSLDLAVPPRQRAS